MITGDTKNKIDRIWDAFWSGGISNPMEVIEQITYLLFLRRLDDLQTEADQKAMILGGEPDTVIFRADEQHLRWQNFKNEEPASMFETVANEVFPFMRSHAARVGGDGSTYSHHMRDARFTIPSPALLTKVVDQLSEVPMENADTNGDLYEYLLSKIASAGVNGQFRTPRHIIDLMVQMMDPTGGDTICDPACGTAGFLVASAEYLVKQKPQIFADSAVNEHFHRGMFHGYDFDSTMLRIGSMNMLLHGVQSPDIEYRDSLSEGASADAEKYSLILANPPFAGSLDYDQTSQELLKTVKTKKTELLFLALFLKLLKPGGRAAVIVPDGVLFGSSTAHKTLRKMLVEEQKLDAVVKLPSGVFKPYAGVSTAILFFTKTNSGGTDEVWFYDVQADGFSLDDKRNPIEANDLPDVLVRWKDRDGAERERARTEKSFTVPKAEIVEQDYDLSLNRYNDTTRPVPYLAVANVQAGKLKLNNAKYIEATEAEINKYRLEKGDVVLAKGEDPNNLGHGTAWNNELPEYIYQNHIFQFRLNKDSNLTPEFVAGDLKHYSKPCKYFLKTAKPTTSIASINKTTLASSVNITSKFNSRS